MRISAVLLLFILVPACGKANNTTVAHDMAIKAHVDASLIMRRPYQIDVPAGLDNATPVPLILLLHGYGATGALQDGYFGFDRLATDRRVLVAHPDGTLDSHMQRFWNADDACCDGDNIPVDDVAYLNAVVEDVETHYNVDTKQVYAVGHSNGAFMAHRLACDTTARFAAIVALAGDVWKDASKCNPTGPIAVLQVHGDADQTIPYAGNATMPSAMESVGTWATKNGCTGTLTATGQTYDLDSTLAGAETVAAAYACTQGAAELWTITGGMHVPGLIVPDWGNHVFDWLTAHKRQ